MAAQSTKEKLEKIEKLWHMDEHIKLIYEWVKTGNLSRSEFERAIDLISRLKAAIARIGE